MQKLRANEIIHITEKVLRLLSQNRITTIVDFLQEDVSTLSAVTKLNLPQILAVRKEIFEKYAAPIKTGTILLNRKIYCLKTGIGILDSMLEGGLPVGCITEICGLADSGKTQLCFQVAINCTKSSGSSVLYIDTKGDFSAVRVQKILDTLGYSHKEMADIMHRIKVVRVWTMEEAIQLLQSVKNKSFSIENLILIVIDSLPCLMLQFLGDDNKIGLSMLNTLVNYTRYLCREMDICMMCVNIQTRWVDQDVADLEDDEDCSTLHKDMFIEKRNRCLGKYWQHIPNLVLLLEKMSKDNTQIGEKLTVLVMKSNKLNIVCGQCTLHISDSGVICNKQALF